MLDALCLWWGEVVVTAPTTIMQRLTVCYACGRLIYNWLLPKRLLRLTSGSFQVTESLMISQFCERSILKFLPLSLWKCYAIPSLSFFECLYVCTCDLVCVYKFLYTFSRFVSFFDNFVSNKILAMHLKKYASALFRTASAKESIDLC